jgi:hypothetical protein
MYHSINEPVTGIKMIGGVRLFIALKFSMLCSPSWRRISMVSSGGKDSFEKVAILAKVTHC